MTFDLDNARQIAATYSINSNSEQNLVESFAQICSFLADNPDRMSWRGKNSPSIFDEEGLKILANRYFSSYRKSDFPAIPSTVPDQMVSIVMEEAYGYTPEQCKQIKVSHQHSMCAENCVGALLERYLDSVLRSHDWYWCCGDFVKAIDFVKRDPNGIWLTLQIKNRDNSENSSSSAIRHGTPIQKWFRSFSKKEDTNWKNLPELMQGYSLDENGFIEFVKSYLKQEKEKIHQ